jgi:alkylation response protein AidB-like acyl-CoA dehydrogenase
MAKRDASVSTFVLVHNSVGSGTIDMMGNQEQKDRILPNTINMDKIASFALTEPLNGSDASGLKTTATRTEGGYLLNGHKRWIGSATFAAYHCVWAKFEGKVQCFVVDGDANGLKMHKIENKYALRMVQNGDFTLENVFVPERNRLEKAKDFASGANQILEKSRLGIAWTIAGVAFGAYEAALKYALSRNQFGRPIA